MSLPRLANLLILRRVAGDSMSPTLDNDQLVLASSLSQSQLGDVVIAQLTTGREIIKRLSAPVAAGQRFALLSDNSGGNNYSSQLVEEVKGKVIWPRL